jgi:mono/diheme cytochrome c family protein
LNLDEIFPPGEGRDLVLVNCLTCHGLVRIVWGQRDAARWGPVKNRHRERLIGLSDEEFNTLFAYLVENFNATKPVPDLPQWYLEFEGYVYSKKPQ